MTTSTTKLAALAFLCLLSTLTAQTWIVENGQPRAQIVIAEQPTRMTRLAASELQSYIARITGAKLPITDLPDALIPVNLYIGPSEEADALGLSADGLAHGAYRLQSGDTWLAFIGEDADFQPVQPYGTERNRSLYRQVLQEWDEMTGDTFGLPYLTLHSRHFPDLNIWDIDKRGTINAVYGYLRSLGVRWFFPGELGEIVPTQASLALPEVDETVTPDFALRSFRIYHEHLGLPKDYIMWKLRMGTNHGDELIGRTLPGHGSKFVYTRDEMKEAHPEMYALWGGKRATDHRECGAPCLSSPLLLQKNLSYARHIFDHYGDRMLSADVCDGYAWLCACELCEGKGTPERGWTGQLSDYVWGYVEQVASELHKTHPDRRVSGLSYGAYRLPPQQIEQFSPNVAIIICQSRARYASDASHQDGIALRQTWLDMMPSKELYTWDYYITTDPRSPYGGFPTFIPRLIAKDLKSQKGVTRGEMIEVYNEQRLDQYPWHDQATNHLNLYITSRLWWDADQDVEQLLDEYYQLYYGPASAEMEAFVDYSEANWQSAVRDPQKIDRMLELIATARAAAGDTIYGQRIQLIADYMDRLHEVKETLAVSRDNVPIAEVGTRPAAQVTIDGRLDDAFWEGTRSYQLVDVESGGPATVTTTYQLAWGSDDALYLAIRCDEPDMENLNIGTRSDNDTSIWLGDTIEVLLETQVNAYYQIAVNPAGAVIELDRGRGLNTLWTANGDVAAHIGDDGWTVELRLPVAGMDAKEINVNLGIAGATPTAELPWFINVCRQRIRGDDTQLSTWSPTGRQNFHEINKFGKVYVK